MRRKNKKFKPIFGASPKPEKRILIKKTYRHIPFDFRSLSYTKIKLFQSSVMAKLDLKTNRLSQLYGTKSGLSKDFEKL